MIPLPHFPQPDPTPTLSPALLSHNKSKDLDKKNTLKFLLKIEAVRASSWSKIKRAFHCHIYGHPGAGLWNFREFSFSTKEDGSATVVVLSQGLSFLTQRRFIPSTVVEIEGRPSSKLTHVQVTPNVIFTVAEPSVF